MNFIKIVKLEKRIYLEELLVFFWYDFGVRGCFF